MMQFLNSNNNKWQNIQTKKTNNNDNTKMFKKKNKKFKNKNKSKWSAAWRDDCGSCGAHNIIATDDNQSRLTIDDQIESTENGNRPSSKTPLKVQHNRSAAVDAEDWKSQHRNAKHDDWSEDFGTQKRGTNVRQCFPEAGCKEWRKDNDKTTMTKHDDKNEWMVVCLLTDKCSPSKMHRCVLEHRQVKQERCSRKQRQNEPRQEDLGKWEWLKQDPTWNQDAENARTKECMIEVCVKRNETKWWSIKIIILCSCWSNRLSV